ncbi:hypothetical protein ACFU9F_12230 [Streptomyces zhihengii]|uniref:hypothetical protein n=1 Tax=Streptomyces zhihengii TaxID=1818004 RepID=UPI00369EBC0A
MDIAAKDAAIAAFRNEYPGAVDAGRGHPAVRGCEEISWSEFPECPAGIPILLYGLLDEAAADEAQRVFTDVMFCLTGMNPAVPEALPFLLRLAAEPRVPERSALLALLAYVAGCSEPTDGLGEAAQWWFGSDADHPERERCRAVFTEHADVVAALPDGLTRPDDRAKLRWAAGLP